MPLVTTYDIYKYDYTVAHWHRLQYPDHRLQQEVVGLATRHDTAQRSSQQHPNLELSSGLRTSVDTTLAVPRISQIKLQGLHTPLSIVQHDEQLGAATLKIQ